MFLSLCGYRFFFLDRFEQTQQMFLRCCIPRPLILVRASLSFVLVVSNRGFSGGDRGKLCVKGEYFFQRRVDFGQEKGYGEGFLMGVFNGSF